MVHRSEFFGGGFGVSNGVFVAIGDFIDDAVEEVFYSAPVSILCTTREREGRKYLDLWIMFPRRSRGTLMQTSNEFPWPWRTCVQRPAWWRSSMSSWNSRIACVYSGSSQYRAVENPICDRRTDVVKNVVDNPINAEVVVLVAITLAGKERHWPVQLYGKRLWRMKKFLVLSCGKDGGRG